MDEDRSYIAIDLKSFYASVECMERQLDPLNTNLVVSIATLHRYRFVPIPAVAVIPVLPRTSRIIFAASSLGVSP